MKLPVEARCRGDRLPLPYHDGQLGLLEGEVHQGETPQQAIDRIGMEMAGIKDLQDARRLGELRDGIEHVDAYQTIMSAVGGVGLTAVMNPTQLSPRDQVQVLKNVIDSLRP